MFFDNFSPAKRRHHAGKYNFCNGESSATLPANRMSAAAIFKQCFSHTDFSPTAKTITAGCNKKETGVVTGEAGVGAGLARERRRVVRLQTLLPACSCSRCLIVFGQPHQRIRNVEPSAARMFGSLLQRLNSGTSWVQDHDSAKSLFVVTTEDNQHSDVGIQTVHGAS